jgi:hypothetical protein
MSGKKTWITTPRKDGALPQEVNQEILDYLVLRGGRRVSITIGPPARSTQANRYYWTMLRWQREQLRESGVDTMTVAISEATGAEIRVPLEVEMLHEIYKSKYGWPVGGSRGTKKPSTSEMDSTEFFDYVERCRLDEEMMTYTDGQVFPSPSRRLSGQVFNPTR